MTKEWKKFHSEECPNCGSKLEVLSDCRKDTEFEIWVNDGDEVRCEDGCGFISAISADEGEVWVQDGNINELEEAEI